MKKTTLIALLFVLGWQANAQISETPDIRKNELKVDVAYLLLGSVAKVEYEYLLNEWSSAGVSALYDFTPNSEPTFKIQVLGFYRLFFGNHPNSGFFLEGNLGVISGKDDSYHYDPSSGMSYTSYDPYTTLGAGIALGWKYYIPKSSIVLDLFFGYGRMFIDNNNIGGYPRAGLCVGKRF